MFAKRFRFYLSYYLKKLSIIFLRSRLCYKNKVCSLILKSHSLNRLEGYKKYPQEFIQPKNIEIELTNKCNVDCVFCPNSKHNRARGVMLFSTFRKIVDQINSSKANQVIIGGFGESLIDKELIEKLTYLRKNTSVKVELVTNGILLTEDICEAICKGRLLDSLDVSIDAADSKTYNQLHKCEGFDTVVNNLKFFSEAKKRFNYSLPFVRVRFKDFNSNKGGFRKFVNIFSGISDEVVAFMNIFKWPGSEMKVDFIDRKRLIRIPCPSLWEGIRINWNGDLVLCCMDYEGRVVLGNIKDKSISDIWNSDRIKSYRDSHRRFQFDNLTICNDCDINSHLVIPW